MYVYPMVRFSPFLVLTKDGSSGSGGGGGRWLFLEVILSEKAEKYLWVDAATSSGVLGAVLAQKISSRENEKFVPVHLDLYRRCAAHICNSCMLYEILVNILVHELEIKSIN
jgi:hypothetical protein